MRYSGLGFDPVPGDARRVAALADALTAAGRHADDAHGMITGAITASSAWLGDAADEFRRGTADLPQRLAEHGDTTGKAAGTLYEWAATLTDQQRRADQLDRRAKGFRASLADADQLVDEWTTAVSVAGSHTRPTAEATLAGHVRERDRQHAALSSVLAEAHDLAAEHRAAAERTTNLLRALLTAEPPAPRQAGSFGTVLTGLSDATRRANAVAGLATAGPVVVPPIGAVAVAAAAEPVSGGTWVFGPAVPVERLVAAMSGGRRGTT